MRKRPPAEIIPLEDFRNKVGATPSNEPYQKVPYRPVDYLAYHGISRALELVRCGKPSKGLSIMVQYVKSPETHVTRTINKNKEIIAISASKDQLEAITLDLDVAPEDYQKRLSGPLERMFLATAVVKPEINLDKKLIRSRYISLPRIGMEELQLRNDNNRESITRNRVAAGIGLLAVGRNRPDLRNDISNYLNSVLEDRHNYLMGLANFSEIFGSGPDDQLHIEEFLIGFCNPLNQHGLKHIFDSSQQK